MSKNFQSMVIFNGKKIADKILSDLKKKTDRLKVRPKLAVILAGEDKSSELFIRNKKRAAREIGIEVLLYKFKEDVPEKEIIRKIKSLNDDKSVQGIIVQLPLPKGFSPEKIVGAVSPLKDVDGFGKKSSFPSPFISALLIALKNSTKDIKGKKILALVNSDIFGNRLRFFLKKEDIRAECVLRKNFSPNKINKADVVITVLGTPNFIKGNIIKRGVILIDGGITVTRNKKTVGDVDRKSVSGKAAFLTPVPGGTGPLTVALLLKNVYLAANKHG